jgi:hypothetical protein
VVAAEGLHDGGFLSRVGGTTGRPSVQPRSVELDQIRIFISLARVRGKPARGSYKTSKHLRLRMIAIRCHEVSMQQKSDIDYYFCCALVIASTPILFEDDTANPRAAGVSSLSRSHTSPRLG